MANPFKVAAGKPKKDKSTAKIEKKDDLKHVNERLNRNYGKTNKEISTTVSVEPGVRDTPAVKALREGDTSTVSKKIIIKPSGRPSGEQYALQKMRNKGILDKNNKVVDSTKKVKKIVIKKKS